MESKMKMSDENKIEIFEADTVDEAKNLLKNQKPKGYIIFSVDILSDGKPITIKEVGDSVDLAYNQAVAAAAKILPDYEILEKKILSKPEDHVLNIKAKNESEAKSMAIQGRKNDEVQVKSINLKELGTKGFLGIGAKPNTYELLIHQKAVVELVIKGKARVQARLGPIPKHSPPKFRIWFFHSYLQNNQSAVYQTLNAWIESQRASGNNISIDSTGSTKFEVEPSLVFPGLTEEQFISGQKMALKSCGDDPELFFYYNGIALYPQWS
jgi:hypothetical protein